jgi:hypothetical protein
VEQVLPAWAPLVSSLFDPHPGIAHAAAQLLGTAGAILWATAQATPAPAAAAAAAAPAPASSPAAARRGRGGGRGGRGRGDTPSDAPSVSPAATRSGPPPELLLDWLLPLLRRASSPPGLGLATPEVQVGEGKVACAHDVIIKA